MNKWKGIVSSVAPTIATALGGPLAGLATKALAEGLLGRPSATDEEMYQALLEPESLVELKRIDTEFEVSLKELGVKLEEIAVDDRKSARSLGEKKRLHAQVVLSVIFILGFFLVLVTLFSGLIVLTDSIENLAFLLLGILGSGVTMILKFWFGGSPNDEKQMENIYNSIPKDKISRRERPVG